MRSINDYSTGRENNFNLIRLIAAIIVMLSHSYTLARSVGDPLYGLLGMDADASHVAVYIFFAISGFLVTASFCRSVNIFVYAESRFLRIYPGLLVSVLFCSFLVGPLFTSMSLGDYFSSRALWEFIWVNSALVLDKIQLRYLLPGVFSTNPYSQAVNGSLWTLPYEVWMYIALAGLGVLGIFRKRWVSNILITSLLSYLLFRYSFADALGLSKPIDLERFSLYFVAGIALYINRVSIPMTSTIAIVLVIATGLTRLTIFYRLFFPFALVYCVFWLAYVPAGWIRNINRVGDYSFGTYVYAFPVQQSLVFLIPSIDPRLLFLIASVITLGLAVCSWHLVEKPALERKGTLFTAFARLRVT